jgi:hypothetical protein
VARSRPLLPVPFLAASPVSHALRPGRTKHDLAGSIARALFCFAMACKEKSRIRLGSVLCDRLVQCSEGLVRDCGFWKLARVQCVRACSGLV